MGLKATTQAREWTALGQMMQQVLEQHWGQTQPLQIRCACRGETLLVLAEHLLHVEPNPESTFSDLEKIIRVLVPEALQSDFTLASLPEKLPVQLFLRIAGYQQAYALHTFQIELKPIVVAAPLPQADELDFAGTFDEPTAQIETVSEPEALAEPIAVDPVTVEPITVVQAEPEAVPEPEALLEASEEQVLEDIPDEAVPESVVAEAAAATEVELAETEVQCEGYAAASAEVIEAANPPELVAEDPRSEPIEFDTPAATTEIVELDLAEFTPEPELDNPPAAEVIAAEPVEPELVEPEIVGSTVQSEPVEPELVESTVQLEPVEPEPVEPEPVEPELVEPELVEPESAELESVEPELVEPESVELEPVETIVQPEVVESESVELESVETIIQPEPVEPEPVELESVEPEIVETIVQPEPVEPEPVELEPVEPESVEPELVEMDAVTSVPDVEAVEPDVAEEPIAKSWSEASTVEPAEIPVTPPIAADFTPISDPWVELDAEEGAGSENAIEVSETLDPEPSQSTETFDFEADGARADIEAGQASVEPFSREIDADVNAAEWPDLTDGYSIEDEDALESRLPTEIAAETDLESPSLESDVTDAERSVSNWETLDASQPVTDSERSEDARVGAVEPEAFVQDDRNQDAQPAPPNRATESESYSAAALPNLSGDFSESTADDAAQTENFASDFVPHPRDPRPRTAEPKPASAHPVAITKSAPEAPVPAAYLPRRTSRWTASSLALTGAVSAFVIVTGGYLLTRPCVIGSCEQLQRAQQLSQEATQTAQTTESALEVVEAYKKLNEANYLLETIPVWSPHHQAAQALLARYENQSIVLGLVVEALEQANTAAQRSQNPPHPLQEWREIQWLWREVIAKLEQIPDNSPLYSLVQRKLQEYRANLTGINQRVGIEQRAQDHITAARQASKLAEARISAAKSAEGWQEVAVMWTGAIAQLQKIPQGTMAHDEAEQLLAIYQPKLAEANTRKAQEQSGANAYAQALDAAEQARVLEQQNKWAQAISAWQTALAYAQQVPNGTAYYNQVRPLIDTYTQTLQQAQENSQRSVAVGSAKSSLDQACSGAPKICSYTLSPQAIRVQFTTVYDRAVEQTITNAQLQGGQSFPPAVVEQVNKLLRTLAEIGEATKVPVELYNSSGTKLGTYTPSLSGYVAQ